MARDDVYGFLGNRYVMAPGSILQVGPGEGINAISVKMLTGGTLEIGGMTSGYVGFTALAGSVTNSTSVGQTFGVLYPLSTNEIFSGNFAGKMFLYASGATCVVAITVGQSQGF